MSNDDLQRESRVTTWPDYYAEQLRNLRAEPIEYGGKTSNRLAEPGVTDADQRAERDAADRRPHKACGQEGGQ